MGSTLDIFGAPTFNIARAKVAAWLGPGLWGPAFVVPNINMVLANGEIISKKLEGNGGIADVASVLTEGGGQLKLGGISLATLAVIVGQAPVLSGSTPNRINRTKFFIGNMPKFGLTVSAYVNGATGMVQIFFPCCIITSTFMIAQAMQYSYTTPDIKFEAIADPGYSGGGVTEVQTITMTASGGTFTITYNNQTTPPLAYNATTATVQAALQAMTGLGAGNVLVTGTPGSSYVLTFAGQLANQYTQTVVLGTALLTGGSATVAVTTPGVTAQSDFLDVIEWETAPGDIQIPPAA